MEFMKVKSSTVTEIAYDANTKMLFVRFNSGALYSYAGVPQKDYDTLMGAESIGKYFGANIREMYPATKINETVKA